MLTLLARQTASRCGSRMLRPAGSPAWTGSTGLCCTFHIVNTRRQKSRKRGDSSRWLARQRSDPYVRALGERGEGGYVSRSAYKLLQLDGRKVIGGRGGTEQGGQILFPGSVVVDLGAAPGGWTQVALESQCAHIVALDLLPLRESLTGSPGLRDTRLAFVQGDMREDEVHAKLRRVIDERRSSREERNGVEYISGGRSYVDVVLSDMMANTSGNAIRDTRASLDLLEAALFFARRVLRPHGKQHSQQVVEGSKKGTPPATLVLKYFASPEADDFRKDILETAFERVSSVKVAASRSESSEMYFVCRGLRASAAVA